LVKKATGLENIPKLNMIVASNHQSHLDQLMTGYVCAPKPYHYIGQTDKYTGFARLFMYFLYYIHGVIFINRNSEKSRKKAIEKSIEVLKKGDCIVIYPEGTRSRTGEIQETKCGVAKLFLKTGVPILPVGIKGTAELMPIGRVFPKIKKVIEIDIGKPLYFEKELAKAKKLDENSDRYQKIAREITNRVMEEISYLLGDSNNGINPLNSSKV
jgi:1-acyl-sn-glycerol-3-phosphate acyltransferase